MSDQPPPVPPAAPPEPSDAILTVPNLVTFSRLLLLPVFAYLALGPEADLAAWIVGFSLLATDYIDGKLARSLNQVSKLGIAMDPLLDRLALAVGGIVLILRHLVPVWAIVLVVVRDGLVLAAVPTLQAKGIERPPVTILGKRATFGLMSSFGFFFAATIPDPEAAWLRTIGWILFTPGIILSYAAAADYARTVVRAAAKPAA